MAEDILSAKEFQIKSLQDHIMRLEKEKADLELRLAYAKFWVRVSMDSSRQRILEALDRTIDPPVLRLPEDI